MVRVGRSSVKRWAVIFTCMSCLAVHFEVSHTLDTDSFLAAFSRFTARRCTPTTVFSDNATNLVAAEKELQGMLKALDEDTIKHRNPSIALKFLPPGASHMVGVWERLIRSAKSIIRGLLENEIQKLLSDESLYTLLCEVECIMNDRPITSNPHGLDDALALTPSMLLTFRRRCLPLPDDDFSRRNFTQGDGGDGFNIWLLCSGSDGPTSMSRLFSLGANGTRHVLKSRRMTLYLLLTSAFLEVNGRSDA